jgi:hypothetical protein
MAEQRTRRDVKRLRLPAGFEKLGLNTKRRWNLPWAPMLKNLQDDQKKLDFSPAQPWRAETRLFPSKAAASEMKQAEVEVKAEVERGPDPD